MESNKIQEIKDIEIFLLAQFIDVMEALEKYVKIDEIKDDVRKRKQIR